MDENNRGRKRTREEDLESNKRRKTDDQSPVWESVRTWKLTKQGSPTSTELMRAIAKVYATLQKELKFIKGKKTKGAYEMTRQAFGISTDTLGNIIKSVKSTGDVPVRQNKRDRAAPRLNALTDEQLLQVREWIYQAALDGRPYFVTEIVKDVHEKFNVKVSYTTMRRIMKLKLSLRFAKIRSHGTKIENERVLGLGEEISGSSRRAAATREVRRDLACVHRRKLHPSITCNKKCLVSR